MGGVAAKKKQARRDAAIAPTTDDPYEIAYFRRHRDDDSTQVAPGQQFLANVPPAIAARIRAVIIAVAKAPPHKFSGGGKWEAMHDTMAGISRSAWTALRDEYLTRSKRSLV